MSELLQVQYGVQKPKIDRGRKGVQREYPIDTMKVGGFFFVPNSTSKSISAYISRISKGVQGKFSTQHVWAVQNDGAWTLVEQGTPGAVEGTGVWRDE